MRSETACLDISQITEYLYISAWPSGKHTDQILALGVRLILCMHWLRPAKSLRSFPLRLMWLPTIDKPFFPIPIQTLNKGVCAALPVIEDGSAVLVHCKAGIHRSVAMASCILIAKGYSAEQAAQLIKEKRPVADPHVGYIFKRILKFENQWPDFKGSLLTNQ